MQQEGQCILLFRCPVIYRFAIGIDAAHISHIDSCGVVALHSIAYLLDGEKLVGTAIRGDDIVITRILPPFPAELSLEVIDSLLLRTCCAVNENTFNLSHFYCDLKICL